MGRFKAAGVVVRKVDDLTIVFYDSKSIYVYDSRGNCTVFHRWYAPRGKYHDWHEFYKRLRNNRHLSLLKCYELAAEHEVVAQRSDRKFNLNEKGVTFINEEEKL